MEMAARRLESSNMSLCWLLDGDGESLLTLGGFRYMAESFCYFNCYFRINYL